VDLSQSKLVEQATNIPRHVRNRVAFSLLPVPRLSGVMTVNCRANWSMKLAGHAVELSR
jgi:hypothetical protein